MAMKLASNEWWNEQTIDQTGPSSAVELFWIIPSVCVSFGACEVRPYKGTSLELPLVKSSSHHVCLVPSCPECISPVACLAMCLFLLAGQSVPCVGPLGPHTVTVPLTVGGVSQQQSLTAHGTQAVSGCCEWLGNLPLLMIVPALVHIYSRQLCVLCIYSSRVVACTF